ncbi:MAG TPA: ribosome biogenesis GTPase Der [Bacteroidales bacterium]|nr:ribosome biogenesis GTPase Der [Bacteroidales bacterium]HRZ47863.1 ribosome biogenesis GTPase Der [Bacteroidales bacterium]
MPNMLAIVGRPNVGKSTLFNRLIGNRQAIVHESSGVTRDRHYGQSEWNGITFSVIDTGGYVVGSEDVFEEEIRKQAALAIEEADVILFVVDGREGITGMDQDVAGILRKSKKPVFLAANKIDNPGSYLQTTEFYRFGLGEVWPVSAVNGQGTGDLLDELVKHFTPEAPVIDDDLPRFAVVGRPNVGKSSFINALIGTDRNIVTPVAGTTRDTIDTRYNSFGFDFYLVDTAGLRRKAKVKEDIEFYSVMRSIRAIETADVCLLMVDAQQGFEAQDINIFHLAEKNNKGIVILVNKWDLIEKGSNTHLAFERQIRERTAPFTDIPVLFTSVINKQRIHKALETASKVFQQRKLKISTAQLNKDVLPIIEKNPPPAWKGKYVKVKYITQLPLAYPAFAVFCNFPKYVKDPYKRFLENRIRELYDFTGVPVQVYFREK